MVQGEFLYQYSLLNFPLYQKDFRHMKKDELMKGVQCSFKELCIFLTMGSAVGMLFKSFLRVSRSSDM